MKWLISLLLLIDLPVLAQLPPSAVPGPAPYITNMTFTTNEGVVSSFSFTNPPPFTNRPAIMHSPKHLEMLSSLGRPMKKVAAPTATKQMLTGAAQPAMRYYLSWDYPPDKLTNVVFDVYHAYYNLNQSPPLTSYDQIPNGFTLVATVDGYTTLDITTAATSEFYIVRARNKFTGTVSLWNQ